MNLRTTLATGSLLFSAVLASAQIPHGCPIRRSSRPTRCTAPPAASQPEPTPTTARVTPGQTLTLLDVDGPGMISHIWFTISDPEPYHLKRLVLRIYWDGEATPSVEAPIGDFFGLGTGDYIGLGIRGALSRQRQGPQLLLPHALTPSTRASPSPTKANSLPATSTATLSTAATLARCPRIPSTSTLSTARPRPTTDGPASGTLTATHS